eukprot:PhF_6_TR31483/c0_g1_i2/m.46291
MRQARQNISSTPSATSPNVSSTHLASSPSNTSRTNQNPMNASSPPVQSPYMAAGPNTRPIRVSPDDCPPLCVAATHPGDRSVVHRIVWFALFAFMVRMVCTTLGIPTGLPYWSWAIPFLAGLYGMFFVQQTCCSIVPIHHPRYCAESVFWGLLSLMPGPVGYQSEISTVISVALGAACLKMSGPQCAAVTVFSTTMVLMTDPCPPATTYIHRALHATCIGASAAAVFRYHNLMKSTRRSVSGIIQRCGRSAVVHTLGRCMTPQVLEASVRVAVRIGLLWGFFMSVDYGLNISAVGLLVFVSLLLGLRALTRPHPNRTPLEGTQSFFLFCVLMADLSALVLIPRWLLPILGNIVMNTYLLAHLFPLGAYLPTSPTHPGGRVPLPSSVPSNLRARLGKRGKDSSSSVLGIRVPHPSPTVGNDASTPSPNAGGTTTAQKTTTSEKQSTANANAQSATNGVVSGGSQMTSPRVVFLVLLTLIDGYVRLFSESAPPDTLANRFLSANTLGYSAIIFLSTSLQALQNPPPPTSVPTTATTTVATGGGNATSSRKSSSSSNPSQPPAKPTKNGGGGKQSQPQLSTSEAEKTIVALPKETSPLRPCPSTEVASLPTPQDLTPHTSPEDSPLQPPITNNASEEFSSTPHPVANKSTNRKDSTCNTTTTASDQHNTNVTSLSSPTSEEIRRWQESKLRDLVAEEDRQKQNEMNKKQKKEQEENERKQKKEFERLKKLELQRLQEKETAAVSVAQTSTTKGKKESSKQDKGGSVKPSSTSPSTAGPTTNKQSNNPAAGNTKSQHPVPAPPTPIESFDISSSDPAPSTQQRSTAENEPSKVQKTSSVPTATTSKTTPPTLSTHSSSTTTTAPHHRILAPPAPIAEMDLSDTDLMEEDHHDHHDSYHHHHNTPQL